MSMSKGLKRMTMVLALFWVVGWSFVAWWGNSQYQTAMWASHYMVVRDFKGVDVLDPYFRSVHDPLLLEQADGLAKIDLALKIGVFGPLGLLLLSPFIWYVYRGFKPKLPQQSK